MTVSTKDTLRALASIGLATIGLTMQKEARRLERWAIARREWEWLGVAYELAALGRDLARWVAIDRDEEEDE